MKTIMNTNQHTVTIPIKDYNELLAAANDSEVKLKEFRSSLSNTLQKMRGGNFRHMTADEFLNIVINAVERGA